MGIITKDGYKFHDGLMDGVIIVEDSRIDDYVSYINNKKINKISLVEVIAYNLPDISFLEKCKHVEEVSIVGTKIKDLSGLYSLLKLRKLNMTDLKGVVYLNKFSSLVELSSEWNKNLIGLESSKRLKKLGLSKFNHSSKNCESLSLLKNLEELIIVKSNIDSFIGLGELRKLRKIDVSYLKNLIEIDELYKISENLKYLRFDCCKKISNHDYVSLLNNLELLSFDNCGDIRTIKFIKKMKNLKNLIFVGSNILDGDLSLCSNLEYVGFVNKKHYSHKMKDFKRY